MTGQESHTGSSDQIPGSRGPNKCNGRLPSTLAVLGITGIATFSLSFLSVFITGYATVAVGHAPEETDAHNVAEALASAGLASYVLTSLIVVLPLAYLAVQDLPDREP